MLAYLTDDPSICYVNNYIKNGSCDKLIISWGDTLWVTFPFIY